MKVAMEEELLLEETSSGLRLSKSNFLYLNMLASRCGIDLNSYDEQAVHNRLVKRIRYLKLPNFDVYCHKLRVDLEEEIKFINLITNPTTYFFRENHHFEYLAKTIIPGLLAVKNKIRIWSAGCSTGEEAYSLGMILHESIANIDNCDIKILATDINSDSLMKAEKGIYDADHVKKVSFIRQKIWFEKINETEFQVNPKLREIITFNQLNLMDCWPIHGPFDVIFCRNVLIYFKEDITNTILAKFHDLLDAQGFLVLGYSENLYKQRKHFENLGRSTYKKIL
jgi:chemotaxis protein methyltransferase CheR